MSNTTNNDFASIGSLSGIWHAAHKLQTHSSPIFEEDEQFIHARDRLVDKQISLVKDMSMKRASTFDEVWDKLNVWATSVDISELDSGTYDGHHAMLALSAIEDLRALLNPSSEMNADVA